MVIYRLVIETFGYDIIVQEKTIMVLNTLQIQFISNFQIPMFFLSIYLLFDGNIVPLIYTL